MSGNAIRIGARVGGCTLTRQVGDEGDVQVWEGLGRTSEGTPGTVRVEIATTELGGDRLLAVASALRSVRSENLPTLASTGRQGVWALAVWDAAGGWPLTRVLQELDAHGAAVSRREGVSLLAAVAGGLEAALAQGRLAHGNLHLDRIQLGRKGDVRVHGFRRPDATTNGSDRRWIAELAHRLGLGEAERAAARGLVGQPGMASFGPLLDLVGTPQPPVLRSLLLRMESGSRHGAAARGTAEPWAIPEPPRANTEDWSGIPEPPSTSTQDWSDIPEPPSTSTQDWSGIPEPPSTSTEDWSSLLPGKKGRG